MKEMKPTTQHTTYSLDRNILSALESFLSFEMAYPLKLKRKDLLERFLTKKVQNEEQKKLLRSLLQEDISDATDDFYKFSALDAVIEGKKGHGQTKDEIQAEGQRWATVLRGFFKNAKTDVDALIDPCTYQNFTSDPFHNFPFLKQAEPFYQKAWPLIETTHDVLKGKMFKGNIFTKFQDDLLDIAQNTRFVLLPSILNICLLAGIGNQAACNVLRQKKKKSLSEAAYNSFLDVMHIIPSYSTKKISFKNNYPNRNLVFLTFDTNLKKLIDNLIVDGISASKEGNIMTNISFQPEAFKHFQEKDQRISRSEFQKALNKVPLLDQSAAISAIS